MKPLFSICITTYRAGNTISYCLDNIIKTFKPFSYEVILVDNYSDDNTFQIALSYVNRCNITLMKKKCSRGKGRQICLKISKGKYIIPIDADNILIPRIMQSLIKAYLKSEFKDKKILATLSGPIGIYPKCILSKVGGWKDLNWGENHELFIRLFKQNLIVTFPINVAIHLNPGSLERRYAHGIQYILRRIKNRWDSIYSYADTLKKRYIRYRYFDKLSYNHIAIIIFPINIFI